MKNRYSSLDILRSLALISMLAFHTVWDLVYLFRIEIPWFKGINAEFWQQSISWTFILLSGFCFNLGKKRLKRAVTVLICSFIVTAVTAVFMPDKLIIFGVLCFIGSAMLVTIPLDKILKKIPASAGLATGAILFALSKNIIDREISFFGLKIVQIPEKLYTNDITAYFGFPPRGFNAGDYVPFIPWIFLFLCGYFLFRIFEKKDWLKHLSFVSCKPFEFIGRNTLYIYMTHQPIIYGILYLILK